MTRLAKLLLLASLVLTAIVANALLLEGCGAKHRNYYTSGDGTYVTIGSLTVVYRGDQVSDAQQRACEAAIAAVVSEWQANEPVPVPTVQVEVLVNVATECDPGAAGCALLGRGRVQVVAWYRGYEWSCPALYHELAHIAYGIRGHADPRWKVWTPRGWALGVKWARPDLSRP